jgi:L-lactate dehydrogenase complex protein LldE
MLIHHYAELLAGDPVYGPKAQALAARTFEFTQFLEQVVGTTDVGGRCPGSVTYHASCHGLRGLNNRTAPGQLLSHVAGADLRPLGGAEECCGFGGLFAVKMAGLSSAMLARKLDHIAATGAETVTGCDISCLMHIVGGARKRGQSLSMKHIAELLVD